MKRNFITLLSALLILLTLGGVHSVYHLTNFLCMARAQPAYQHLWLARIYIWFGISLSLGFVWIALLILIVRRGRSAD